MRNLLESAPVGIFLANQGIISFGNKALSTMFGFSSPDEMHGLKLDSCFRDGKVSEQMVELGKCENHCIREYADLRAVRTGGEVFEVSLYSSKMSSGSKGTIIGFVIDKSLENALRSQLLHSQKMEALGTFAGGIAHDFNNILTIIMGFTEIALMDTDLDQAVISQLNQILDASKRARDLVSQILTFCRKAEHQKKPLNVVPIIKETLKFLEASFPVTIKIESRIKDDGKLILGDPSQFHQILMNLCSNAGYAMRKQGGVLEVDLQVLDTESLTSIGINMTDAKEYLKLTVKDTGPGIAQEIREKIFEPYFTTKPVGEGSGLGLAVVHGIVTSYGGAIRLNEGYVNGACFEVYLPVTEPTRTVEEHDSSGDLYGNQRIIVVDDEKYVTEILRKMLESLGYKVFAFTNPVIALNIFRVGPYDFDLVMTDLTMNEMTGLELAREARKIRPDISVILLTGYDDTEGASTRDLDAIDEIIHKPFTNKILARAVKKTLASSKKALDHFDPAQ